MIRLIIVGVVGLTLIFGVLYLRFSQTQGSKSTNLISNLTGDNSLGFEDRITTLEKAVTNLIKQPSPIASPTTKLGSSDLETRIFSLEDSLKAIKARLVNLEQSSTTTVTTSTSKNPLYIPLGSSGSTIKTDWTSIDTLTATIDPKDYSGYTSMQLELSLSCFQSNGKAFARLYNSDDGTALLSSEVSTTSSSYTFMTSAGFQLESGKKTYKLQLKSLTGYSADAVNIRIKVNF